MATLRFNRTMKRKITLLSAAFSRLNQMTSLMLMHEWKRRDLSCNFVDSEPPSKKAKTDIHSEETIDEGTVTMGSHFQISLLLPNFPVLDRNIFIESFDELKEKINQYSLQTGTQWVGSNYRNPNFGNTEFFNKSFRLHMSDDAGGLINHAHYILNSRDYLCHRGPDRNRALKRKRQTQRDMLHQEDRPQVVKRRHLVQTSVKVNCPAVISVKEIFVVFADCSKPLTSYGRRCFIARIKQTLKTPDDISKVGRRMFHVIFPENSIHNHSIGADAGSLLRMDPSVADKAKELVQDGIKDIKIISTILKDHVISKFQNDEIDVPPPNNRQFFPRMKEIRSLKNREQVKMNRSKFDQENVDSLIQTLKEKQPEDNLEPMKETKIDTIKVES